MADKPTDKSQSPEACEASSAAVSKPSEETSGERQSQPVVRRSGLTFRTHVIGIPARKGKFAKGFHTIRGYYDGGYEIVTDYTMPAEDYEPTVEAEPTPEPSPRPMTGLALVNYKTSPENTGAVEKRKSGQRQMDYYTSLDESIEHLKASPKSSSPNKAFWEGTGAIPKYFSKDYKTPPKVLPPFHKPSPTKSKSKNETTPDSKEHATISPRTDGSSKDCSPKSEPSETSIEISSPILCKYEESSNQSSPKSTEADKEIEELSPKLTETDEVSRQSSPKSADIETTSKSTSPKPSICDEPKETCSLQPYQHDELNETTTSLSVGTFDDLSAPSILKSIELNLEVNVPATDLSGSKIAEPVDDASVPSSSAGASNEKGATSSLESEEGSNSSPNSSKPIPNFNIPKTRSDFKDDSQWVRYNCLDFQDYKRTVNNKQKGVEQSINQVLPSMNQAMKDAQRLAVKIDKVRSEVCDKAEALKIQNDKLKYLVGRTMSTLGKIDDTLERFKADILAYTTLTTEGNEGIDTRLSRLLKILCGLDDEQMTRERNALIREAFSEDVTDETRDDSPNPQS